MPLLACRYNSPPPPPPVSCHILKGPLSVLCRLRVASSSGGGGSGGGVNLIQLSPRGDSYVLREDELTEGDLAVDASPR